MRVSHTRVSRLAIVAAGGLTMAQLAVLLTARTGYVVIVVGAVMLVTALAAVKLCRDNCNESRLVTVIVATASAAGIMLSSSMGLPGSSPGTPDAWGVTLLGVALVTLLLIAIDVPRRRPVPHRESPYAL